MSQVPSVLYQCFSVFAFLCLVSNQRAEATATSSLLLKERPPYRVTRDESAQTVTTIWDEDFDLADGTKSDTGPTAWTTNNTSLGTDGDNYFEVRPSGAGSEKMLVAKNTDGEVVWKSAPIDITGYSDVKLSAYIRGDGPSAMDGYLRLYYRLNDGPLNPWLNGLQRGNFDETKAMIDGINGSKLELIIRAKNTTDDDYYKIDNIKVYTEPSERHAIQDGNWDIGSTWSYTAAGPTCSCTPDLLSDTYVDGHAVSIRQHSNTRHLTIGGSGKVQWTATKNLRFWGDAQLKVEQSGELAEQGGQAYVSFNQWNQRETHDATETPANLGYPGVSAAIVVDQPTSFQISGIQFNAAGNFTIQGTGNIETTLDIDITHEANITNDLDGNLLIGDDLSMDFPGSTFVNNHTLLISDQLRLNRTGILFNNGINAYLSVDAILQINENDTFTNQGTVKTFDLAMSTTAVGGGELINRGMFQVDNSFDTYNKLFTVHNYSELALEGTVNFADQLSIHNHEQAKLYFFGGSLDADLQLFAGYADNEVDYDGSTNQPVLIPRDLSNPVQPGSYWNLSLTNAGATSSVKTPVGTLDINGNLTVRTISSGQVTLDVSANNTNINLAGDWWRYDKNASSFVAGSTTNNETVTFDGDSDQRLRTYERFISVVVDKTGDLLLEEGSSVAGAVTFKQGVVIAQNDQPLVFRPNAQAANASGISHVVGPVTKQGGADFTFPVGDGTHYRPLQLTGLTNSTTDFTVEYRAIDPTTGGYATSSVGSPLINVGQCAYWEVARTETADAEAFVTLTWDETSCPIDINDLAIARWDGTQWVEVPGTITGDANSGSITSTSRLSAFGAFTLTEKNDAPQAVDDAAATLEGTSITISVTQNDSDRNGIDSTTVSVIASAQHGTATVDPSTGAIAYTPNTGFAGEDRLRYTVDDIKGLSSAQATVTITVQANEPVPTVVVNTKPLAQPDAFATDEDQELRGDLATNDTDSDQDALTFTLDPDFQPAHGQVAVSPNGTFTYVPDTNFFGPDQFVYQLCDDGNPSLCDTALVTVSVLSVNDAPTAAADTFTVVESDMIIANVATNDTDPEGDRLDYASLLIAPTNGSVILEPSGRFTYQPNRYYVGTGWFTYRICDDQTPPLCDEAEVTIQIQAGLLHVPRAYSPNQDQTNDVWVIPGIRAYPNNEVTVFNRWGNAVYRAKGYNNQTSVWQGEASQGMTLGNQPLPEGTYFYVIDLGEGQKPMSGYVLLKR